VLQHETLVALGFTCNLTHAHKKVNCFPQFVKTKMGIFCQIIQGVSGLFASIGLMKAIFVLFYANLVRDNRQTWKGCPKRQ